MGDDVSFGGKAEPTTRVTGEAKLNRPNQFTPGTIAKARLGRKLFNGLEEKKTRESKNSRGLIHDLSNSSPKP